MKDTVRYQRILGLTSEWQVMDVELDMDGGTVDVDADQVARRQSIQANQCHRVLAACEFGSITGICLGSISFAFQEGPTASPER